MKVVWTALYWSLERPRRVQPDQYATRPCGLKKSMIPDRARKKKETKTVREMTRRIFIYKAL